MFFYSGDHLVAGFFDGGLQGRIVQGRPCDEGAALLVADFRLLNAGDGLEGFPAAGFTLGAHHALDFQFYFHLGSLPLTIPVLRSEVFDDVARADVGAVAALDALRHVHLGQVVLHRDCVRRAFPLALHAPDASDLAHLHHYMPKPFSVLYLNMEM